MAAKTIEEREIKLRVPNLATYERIASVLGSASLTINQRNVYFDTPDFRLATQEMVMIRIRLVGEKAELCIKDRACLSETTLSVRERSLDIRWQDWQRLDSGQIGLTELPNALCQEILASYGALMRVGETVNVRQVFELAHSYQLELDLTTFPGNRVDYEIELELQAEHHTFDEAREVLSDSLGADLMVALTPSSPKYQRFVDALLANQ